MNPIDLVALLRCPRCAGALVAFDEEVRCAACGAAFPIVPAERSGAGPIVDLSPRATSAHEAAHVDGRGLSEDRNDDE